MILLKVLIHSNVIRVLPKLQVKKSLLATCAVPDVAYTIAVKLLFTRYVRPSCLIFMLADLTVR